MSKEYNKHYKSTDRSGFCSIVGAPNSGKSTLFNALLGREHSSVTHKIHTTRIKIEGVTICDRSQIFWVDTPGFSENDRNLSKEMINIFWNAIYTSHVVLFIIDASRNMREINQLIHSFFQCARKNQKSCYAFVLNKVDLVSDKEKLFHIAHFINTIDKNVYVWMISAKKQKGIKDIEIFVAKNIPKSKWAIDSVHHGESFIDEKQRASITTQKYLLLFVHQEIPYSSHIETVSVDSRYRSITIHQNICIQQESHRSILVGKNGETIKRIGSYSRAELSVFFGKKVHLFLRVIVAKTR